MNSSYGNANANFVPSDEKEEDPRKQGCSMNSREQLKKILRDKLKGTNTSGVTANKLDTYSPIRSNTPETDIPVGAFTDEVDGIVYALKRFGKWEVAQEELEVMGTIARERVLDWYDEEKIKKSKKSKLEYFALWVSKNYSPNSATILSFLNNSGITRNDLNRHWKEATATGPPHAC